MRGGEPRQGPVRYKQFDILAKALGADFEGVILGDMNCKLPHTPDVKPLTNAGFKLLNPGSTAARSRWAAVSTGTSTWLCRGKLGKYAVRAIFENKVFGRAFADHGVLSAEMRLCDVTGANDDSCSTKDSDTGDFGDNPSGDGKVEPQD